MVDYDFYVNSFMGSAVPEKDFSGTAVRAAAILDRFLRIYRVQESTEEAKKMAVCAMAESIYMGKKRQNGVTAQSVGNVSVRYETGEGADKALMRELYRRASVFLEFSRGVR